MVPVFALPPRLGERSSGVLLHPTSLPGPHGSGDFGPEARRFADFLAAAGQRWWQMLPLGPTGYGNSPYSAESAFALSPLLIDLHALTEDGLLDQDDLEAPPFPADRVDYAAAARFREPRLRKAFAAFTGRLGRGSDERARLEAFTAERRAWLDDFTLFRALKRARAGAPWTAWEPELRAREPSALARARSELAPEIAFHVFEQYLASRQLLALRAHAAASGIGLIGDLPIFVAHDSADVWQHQPLFKLDELGMPAVVAGVPPDYFSRTGQRWGNPLYRWDALARTGYAWWIDRLRVTFDRVDAARLDHFIGFTRAWEIPARSKTAEGGRWVPGPGVALFEAARAALGPSPLIAEDLGAVTPEVETLRDRLELPGMRVLQFAFGDDPSAPSFLPHNYPRRTVACTGTHDNDTVVGWFHDPGGRERSPEQVARERELALAYLDSDGAEIHWDMLRMVLLSVADTAIVPAQDLLGLGSEARMNRPGVPEGNWSWRLREGALGPELAARLARLCRLYGRTRDPEAAR
jgi:4-alpha-glucanotransferase